MKAQTMTIPTDLQGSSHDWIMVSVLLCLKVFPRPEDLVLKSSQSPGPTLAPPFWTPDPCHLQNLLIIKFTKDSAIDLIGFQCCPVEDWQPELGLDRFLDANG